MARKKKGKVPDTCDDTSPFSFNKIDRVVSKGGKYHIRQEKPDGMNRFNPFNVVNLLAWNWCVFFCFFLFLYIASFIFFSLLYYSVLWTRNDWSHIEGNAELSTDKMPMKLQPCFVNIESYADCFLFSVDTQTTIGPGVRVPADHCPEVVLLVIIQSLWGVILNVVFTGFVIGRLVKPKQPTHEHHDMSGIIFSKWAAITARNKNLYFIFRVAEMRENVVDYGVNISACCIKDIVTQEGENIPLHTEHMDVGCEVDGKNSTVPLMWPMVMSHRIDESSPLYDHDRVSLNHAKLEIYVRVWGDLQGTLISARTSYLPREIYWGAHFTPNTVLKRAIDGNIMSFSLKDINAIQYDITPPISAKKLAQKWIKAGLIQNSMGYWKEKENTTENEATKENKWQKVIKKI